MSAQGQWVKRTTNASAVTELCLYELAFVLIELFVVAVYS